MAETLQESGVKEGEQAEEQANEPAALGLDGMAPALVEVKDVEAAKQEAAKEEVPPLPATQAKTWFCFDFCKATEAQSELVFDGQS